MSLANNMGAPFLHPACMQRSKALPQAENNWDNDHPCLNPLIEVPGWERLAKKIRNPTQSPPHKAELLLQENQVIVPTPGMKQGLRDFTQGKKWTIRSESYKALPKENNFILNKPWGSLNLKVLLKTMKILVVSNKEGVGSSLRTTS